MTIMLRIAAWILVLILGTLTLAAQAEAQGAKKPNILIIWGDDIGQFNVSAYNQGMMGYRTPNIDSIARQGALFTDWSGLPFSSPRARPAGRPS